jgi:hypothetical protein
MSPFRGFSGDIYRVFAGDIAGLNMSAFRRLFPDRRATRNQVEEALNLPVESELPASREPDYHAFTDERFVLIALPHSGHTPLVLPVRNYEAEPSSGR